MYLDYLKERYNESDFQPLSLEQVAEKFETIQQQGLKAQVFKTPRGFITFKLEGDALIIFDMYVTPEFRGQASEGWKLWTSVHKLAEQHNKRVIITFTEDVGKNKHMGERVIQFVGFKPAYKTENGTMFIRGI